MKISPLFGKAEKGAYLFFMSAVGGVGGYQAAKQRMLVKEFAQKAGMSEQDVMAAVREGRIRELASFANDKADAKRQAVKFVDSVQKSINLYMQHRHNIDCIRNGRRQGKAFFQSGEVCKASGELGKAALGYDDQAFAHTQVCGFVFSFKVQQV